MAKVTQQNEWENAVSKAREAIQELLSIQDDCQGRYDELTEKQQEGEKGLAFSKVTDIALQDALDIIDEASDIEIP